LSSGIAAKQSLKTGRLGGLLVLTEIYNHAELRAELKTPGCNEPKQISRQPLRDRS
jgi:hypothetical protein